MGAWGYRSFENDPAADWLCDFLEQPDKDDIQQTLEEVLVPVAEDLEIPECSAAVAAAEVVASLAGHPDDPIDDDLEEFLEEAPITVHNKLIELALAAIRSVTRETELKEIWDEAGYPQWQAAISDLETRLKRAHAEQDDHDLNSKQK